MRSFRVTPAYCSSARKSTVSVVGKDGARRKKRFDLDQLVVAIEPARPLRAFSRYARSDAVPRYREQRKHLRSNRFSPQRAGRVPPEPLRGPQLVPGSQQLRPVVPGPKTAGDDVERRARVPAHVRIVDAADRQSLRETRPGQLLRKPRSLRRHSGDGIADALLDQLWNESGPFGALPSTSSITSARSSTP